MQQIPNLEPADMTPGEAAQLLGVTTKTVAAMKIPGTVVLPSGHRRYVRAEVERVRQQSERVA